MTSLRTFKQKLAAVARLWADENYAAAISEVEALREAWPGNAHVQVLWAGLVQLQEDPGPGHTLDEARQALRRAVELEPSSPAAAIELGHFLDALDDDPRAAADAFAEGISAARRLLVEGLLGRAEALRQLGRDEEARRCALELVQLTQSGPAADPAKYWGNGARPDQEAVARRIEDLFAEVFAGRSA